MSAAAMNTQLVGLEDVAGTYPFDLRASHRALKLNRFFWRMVQLEWRQRFLADPEALMSDAGLSDQEKALVRARDWIGLVRYGVCFFVMEKFARVVRMSNLEVYAAMRGESFEDFMKTRRVPDAR
jgi:protocatechuate 4,5-dioxygenase alpha chain